MALKKTPQMIPLFITFIHFYAQACSSLAIVGKQQKHLLLGEKTVLYF